MLAPDGRCKALDAAASGYTRAEAAGVLLLHPLGSNSFPTTSPLAIIRGSAVNQDGRSSSLTAPNGPAQQAAIRAALAAASLDPAAVTSLQLHGTGTPLGDPIEIGAASAVLRAALPLGSSPTGGPSGPLLLMTSKTWVGHAGEGEHIARFTWQTLCICHSLCSCQALKVDKVAGDEGSARPCCGSSNVASCTPLHNRRKWS
jgi:acyl transferase domain-containing protein